MRYASFGPISRGPVPDEDLLDVLATELDRQMNRQPKSFARRALRKLVPEARRTDPESPAADYVGVKLLEALNEFAPPYGYFGRSPEDGERHGYWLYDGLADDFDGLKVDDLSDIPPDYRGEVLHVNDHGNMTLYATGSRGKLREIWSVV